MSNTDTSLHTAVQNNDINAVAHLLQSGHDPHAANDAGQTPLDIAIQSGNTDIAVLLAGHGVPAITVGGLQSSDRDNYAPTITAKTLNRYFFLWDILLFVSILTFGATLWIWIFVQNVILYCCWKLIPIDIARTAPGKAVLLLFIPFYNLYWMFIAYGALEQNINTTLRRRGIKDQIDVGWGLRYCQLLLLSLPSVTLLGSADFLVSAFTSGIATGLNVTLVILIVVGLVASFTNLFVIINYLREIKKGALALLENDVDDFMSDDQMINQDKTAQRYKIPHLLVIVVFILSATTPFVISFVLSFVISFVQSFSISFVQSFNSAVIESSLQKNAEQGDMLAQFDLGIHYINGINPPNNEEGIRWIRKSAEGGYVLASYALGWFYYNGHGVPQDMIEAVKWFRKAIENRAMLRTYLQEREMDDDSADIKFIVACAYFDGTGVPMDKVKARTMFQELVTENGYPGAQYWLGQCYMNGEGGEKNEKKAVKYYRFAAEQGYPPAQYNLGYCLLNGIVEQQNIKEAIDWFRKSAEQGVPEGQGMLGVTLYFGIEGLIPKDETEGLSWIRKAAEQGDEAAIQFLREQGIE